MRFEKMDTTHQSDVMRIFNHYATTGTAAFASGALPEPFYAMLLKKSENYPAYVMKDGDDRVVGFCQLSPYSPFPTFQMTAFFTCFLHPDHIGRGFGAQALAKLEQEARERGIEVLIAEVSDENEGSIRFHKKHGFAVCGELKNIGHKLDRDFGVVYLRKSLPEQG